MDGWMDVCMYGWMDGWMDGSSHFIYFHTLCMSSQVNVQTTE